MPSERSKREFEAAFARFGEEYGLAPVWHSDTLMCMEPKVFSDSAKLCVDFERGYWPAYEAATDEAREDAVSNVTGQLVRYFEQWDGQIAQSVRATLSAIEPPAG